MAAEKKAIIEVNDLAVGYDHKVLLRDINFKIYEEEIFFIMGPSGGGKSTLLKNMIGLYTPLAGDIRLFGESIVHATEKQKGALMRRFGVTYQSGALLGSLSLLENVSLPMEEHTALGKKAIRKKAEEKLDLVGLREFAQYMPAEISGGMSKRAGLARALALDPQLLFFDEPSAGLDPITSAELDHTIKNLCNGHAVTIVIVSHELDSIFSIGDQALLLGPNNAGVVAIGNPRQLRAHPKNKWMESFLTRSGTADCAG